MDDNNWIKIYTTNLAHQIEIAKAILHESNIESFLMDKTDSMYGLGDMELYVKPDNEILAKLILTQHEL